MAANSPLPHAKMYRVLYIPELLDMIFGMLDHDSNSNNARVCRQWSEIALDSLWRDVDQLERLFGVLAPLRRVGKDEYEFERLPESDDWKRFEKYAGRVRRLVYHSSADNPKIRKSMFDDVARTRTRIDVLPNMHTLQWYAPLSLCVMFMHAGVKHFSVFLPVELETISPRPFFQDIASRMPKLTSIDFRSDVSVRAIEEEMRGLLAQLPMLRKITFPRYYLTSKIAETLSRLENLGIIEFQYHDEQGCGDPSDMIPFAPEFEKGAFPSLWDHSMTTSFADAARFLDVAYAPPNLTMLYIRFEHYRNPIRDPPHALRRRRELPRTQPGQDGDEFTISIDTLKPVLKLPNLTSLEIIHQHPLALKQEDIEVLAAAWPALETLMLNNEPVHLTSSHLSLDALLPFAKHCTKLHHLGLFLDATSVASPISPSLSLTLTPFTSLKKLSMGVSIIDDDRAVALFLSHLLPEGCTVDCGITWEETEDVQDGIVETVSRRCEAWTKVAKFLPVLVGLRMEERERTRAMERELDDLRMRAEVVRGSQSLANGVRLELNSMCILI
ncbi:unnamed protein product [Cyclocybe aegerita]|uniref:F-box domain-containing protein n=1 Tax=Cyclocybe aegerita TaxID=1973307 RepID=A0A8S0W8D8_CYCAE|nr:unnamed protein product [Cyclocybe aegerita]